MPWDVSINKKAVKGIAKMNHRAQAAVALLIEDLKIEGPIQTGWPNYGKLKGQQNCHHCHLNRGRPTYVVCWEEKEINELEVYYASTHENAPY